MEDMDVTDRNFRPCKCGYQICLFCYRHIKDDLNGLCPACRTPYDEANVTFVTPDPQEYATRPARANPARRTLRVSIRSWELGMSRIDAKHPPRRKPRPFF